MGLTALILGSGCLSPSTPSNNEAGTTPDSGPVDPPSPAGPEVPAQGRPHVHDYWEGATEVVLLDAAIPVMVFHNHLFDEPPRPQHTHGCDETLTSTSQGGSVKFSLPPGQLVYPGTQELTFAATWTLPTVLGVRLLYRTANEHDYRDGGSLTNGGALTIPVAPQQADGGHATKTQWGFFLCADSPQPLDLAQGDVAVKLVAHRMVELPLEPAHPDHWNGNDAILLVEESWTGAAVTALNQGTGGWFHLGLSEHQLIPPGATRLNATVTYESTSAWRAVDPGTVLLYWRDSTVPDWIYRKTPPTSVDGDQLRYELSIGDEMADGVYAHESNWDLWLRVLATTNTGAPSGVGQWGAPHHWEGRLAVTVQVDRLGPPPD